MSGVDRGELYALAPDRFVPERNALAKELRAAGKRDEAGEVAALRKPSVAARAVNRLAREHPRELDALLAAGDELIDAQSRVVAGDADARELSRAAERERTVVSDLVRAAGELLSAEGLKPSSAVLERVSETLHAAALDAQARSPVQEGRLERELRHVGFWTGGGDEPATRRPRPAKRSAEKRTRAEVDAEAAAARQREAARKDAQTAVTDARRVEARASRAADSAERRRARAAESLEKAEREDREAEAALTASRQAAQEAAAALQAAERELRALSGD